MERSRSKNEDEITENPELITKMKTDIYYRVEGLRRFCGEQLLLEYGQKEDKKHVMETEKEVKAILHDLQSMLTALENHKKVIEN